jgi:hypothetical protein
MSADHDRRGQEMKQPFARRLGDNLFVVVGVLWLAGMGYFIVRLIVMAVAR